MEIIVSLLSCSIVCIYRVESIVIVNDNRPLFDFISVQCEFFINKVAKINNLRLSLTIL